MPEKQRDQYCPRCGAAIHLQKGLPHGYCGVCASRVTWQEAEDGVVDDALVSILSGDDYYKIAVADRPFHEQRVLLAAKKGSLEAMLDAAGYYISEKEDYATAKTYFESAAKKGSEDGRAGAWMCKAYLAVESGSAENSVVEQLLAEYDRLQLSRFKRLGVDSVKEVANILRTAYNAAKEEAARREREEAARRAYYESLSSYSDTPSYVPPNPYAMTGDWLTDYRLKEAAYEDMSLTSEQRDAIISSYYDWHGD